MTDRQVILFIAASVDGYIATADGSIDFLSTVARPPEDYGYADFIKGVDTVIMGRKTYDKVLSFGIEFPHTGRMCYVLSRTRTGADDHVHYYSGDVGTLIATIRKSQGSNIFIDGGAEVVHELILKNLIDRYVISIVPVMLGGGVRLFKDGRMQQTLRLVRSAAYPSGLVQVWYERATTTDSMEPNT